MPPHISAAQKKEKGMSHTLGVPEHAQSSFGENLSAKMTNTTCYSTANALASMITSLSMLVQTYYALVVPICNTATKECDTSVQYARIQVYCNKHKSYKYAARDMTHHCSSDISDKGHACIATP